MIPLLLSPVPISFYLLYNSYAPSSKLTPGRQIMLDLIVSGLFSYFIYYLTSPYSNPPDFLAWMGFTISVDNYGGMLSCCSIILVLYIGPLVQTAFIEDEGPEFNLPELKSYVTDAFVQEIMFRICSVNLFLACGFGFSVSAFFSAGLYTWSQCFGYFKGLTMENAVKHGKLNEIVQDILRQFVFAMMLGYMYIRTGSLLAVVLVHIFKNFMGFPDLDFVLSSHRLYSNRKVIGLSYLFGLVAGSYLFKLILMDPELFTPWHVTLY